MSKGNRAVEKLIDKHVTIIAEVIDKPIEWLKKVPIYLNIDNVAIWLYEESPEEYDGWDCFPNLAPPWPVIWAEYEVPKFVNQGGVICKNQIQKFFKKVGIFQESVWDDINMVYISNYMVFIENSEGFLWPLTWHQAYITKDGKRKFPELWRGTTLPSTIESMKQKIPNINSKEINLQNINSKEINLQTYKQADSLCNSYWFAICLCHCKNIKIEQTLIDSIVNKKRYKQGKLPLFRFNTIQINPIKKILKTEGQSNKTGLKKALHICRGHFATYTEDAPLFGKIVGTFWKPMHIKGDYKEGVVIKDYKINP